MLCKLKTLIIFASLFVLFSCSDLKPQEQELIGRWEWSLVDGDFGDKGFIELSKNRDFVFYQESWNRVEGKIFDNTIPRFGWRIVDNKLCFATSWSDSEFIEQECPWEVRRLTNGELTIVVTGMFIDGEIQASRSFQDGS